MAALYQDELLGMRSGKCGRKLLQQFGATMDDIADESLFVTDMSAVMGSEEKMGAFFAARAEAYGGNPQVAQSLIGVNELAAPDLMIEIKVVAHV